MILRKKQTKIVATISDRRCDPDFIRNMHEAGMDVVRLNTAHQMPKDSLKIINNVRKISDRIAIIIDTKGPEVRTTKTENDLDYKKGDIFKIAGTDDNNKLCTRDKVWVNYNNFHKDVPLKAVIFIDDGKMEIRVRRKTSDYLTCEVINDGVIKSNKSLNIPGVHLNFPTLNKKDREYIDFSVKNNVDFIAHSFVRNKEDVLAIQKILDKHKSKIKIIAKIENEEGVNNLNEILDYAAGVIVARGDLGVEIPAEEIPLIQKEMIRKCLIRHKPVIVATQMLQSMIKNPRPTRAEVSDVANAILDGTDAIMLSEESASGDYPVEAVEIMARIARRVETNNNRYGVNNFAFVKKENTPANYLIKAAIEATKELEIKEIVLASANSSEAEIIASYRGRTSVYAKCFNQTTARQLALTYGVNAHYVKREENYKKFITKLFRNLVKDGKLELNDKVVFLASDTNKGSEANLLEICEVGRYVIEKQKK